VEDRRELLPARRIGNRPVPAGQGVPHPGARRRPRRAAGHPPGARQEAARHRGWQLGRRTCHAARAGPRGTHLRRRHLRRTPQGSLRAAPQRPGRPIRAEHQHHHPPSADRLPCQQEHPAQVRISRGHRGTAHGALRQPGRGAARAESGSVGGDPRVRAWRRSGSRRRAVAERRPLPAAGPGADHPVLHGVPGLPALSGRRRGPNAGLHRVRPACRRPGPRVLRTRVRLRRRPAYRQAEQRPAAALVERGRPRGVPWRGTRRDSLADTGRRGRLVPLGHPRPTSVAGRRTRRQRVPDLRLVRLGRPEPRPCTHVTCQPAAREAVHRPAALAVTGAHLRDGHPAAPGGCPRIEHPRPLAHAALRAARRGCRRA